MNFIKETHDEKIDGIITERGTKIFNKKDVLICVDWWQKKLFQEMRFNSILSSQNRSYQYYINRWYFQVISRVIVGRVIYQTMFTGKGEVFLFKRVKKILGI